MDWLPYSNPKLELLYKASTDGFRGETFHEKCDLKGPTLTILKEYGGQVFGAFLS